MANDRVTHKPTSKTCQITRTTIVKDPDVVFVRWNNDNRQVAAFCDLDRNTDINSQLETLKRKGLTWIDVQSNDNILLAFSYNSTKSEVRICTITTNDNLVNKTIDLPNKGMSRSFDFRADIPAPSASFSTRSGVNDGSPRPIAFGLQKPPPPPGY